MKKLTRLAIVTAFVTVQACTSNLTSNSLTSSVSSSVTGSDKYDIQWTGTKGNKLFGSYVIVSTSDAPTRAESIEATIPHKVSFSAPKDAVISASGDTLNQGNVEIKIYKNGSECGKAAIVGTGIPANKVCQ